MTTDPNYDVIILGGGATGLSAGLYTCRAMLKTLIIEKLGCGGQILNTDIIENYPGFPQGIQGPDLSRLMEEQTMRHGAHVVFEEAKRLDLNKSLKVVETDNGSCYTAKAIIITTGGSHRKLEVMGEDKYAGKGVSYCATCDGNFFKGQDVVVVGGGDAAIDEGLYLTRMVNKVAVVHRRDELRASPILQQRAFDTPSMTFLWNHTLKEIRGDSIVDRVLLNNLETSTTYEYPTSAVFIYIGFVPNTEFLSNHLALDQGGHIKTNLRMETNISGVFAAGDIRQYSDRQIGTAVGDGTTAALSAYALITGNH